MSPGDYFHIKRLARLEMRFKTFKVLSSLQGLEQIWESFGDVHPSMARALGARCELVKRHLTPIILRPPPNLAVQLRAALTVASAR